MLASIAVTTFAFASSIIAAPVGEPGAASTPLDKRGSPSNDGVTGGIEGTNETETGHVLCGPGRNKPYANRQKELLINEQGELSLGGADPSRYTGTITWAPLIAKSWVAEGTLSVENTAAYTGRIIVHSDENLIVGSPETVKRWWSNVPGSEPYNLKFWNPFSYYTFPCSDPPSVSFTFGGREFPISHADFNLGPTNSTGIACAGAVVALEGAMKDAWVVGGKFVKNIHTVFDEANSRVGFATLD